MHSEEFYTAVRLLGIERALQIWLDAQTCLEDLEWRLRQLFPVPGSHWFHIHIYQEHTIRTCDADHPDAVLNLVLEDVGSIKTFSLRVHHDDRR